MKEKIAQAKDTTTATWKNIVEFIQAISLVVVAGFSGYEVKQGKVTGVAAYVLAGAAAIIAVRGAYELLKHFNKR